jgi:hypothetical protein
MFKLNTNTISSDDGFVVEFGRDRLVYTNDHGSVQINHEMLPRTKSIAIWREPPPQTPTRLLLGSDFDEIVRDVVRAFKAVGYEVVIVGERSDSPAC